MSTSRPPLDAGSWKEPKRMNEGLTRLQTAPGSILALPLQAGQKMTSIMWNVEDGRGVRPTPYRH